MTLKFGDPESIKAKKDYEKDLFVKSLDNIKCSTCGKTGFNIYTKMGSKWILECKHCNRKIKF